MIRAGLPALAALLAVVAGGVPHARASDPACFWVHGRLTAANGAPTFRIWRIGTRRVFGVADDVLPDEVRRRVQPDAFQVALYGDFRICPQAPDRPGRMRPVRLAAARKLAARPVHPYAATP